MRGAVYARSQGVEATLEETRRRSAVRALETAGIGAAGAAVLVVLNVPAGATLGAMLATATAALAGRKLGWPSSIRVLMFLVMGFAAGLTLTPEAIQAALLWPLSIVMLIVATAFMWIAGLWAFARLSPTDTGTAFYASAPGALSIVLILADRQKADMPKVAVAQSIRMLVLVASSPLAVMTGHTIAQPPFEPGLIGGPTAWLVGVAAALAAWKVAERLRAPAPAFLGSMVAAGALQGTGLVHITMPRDLMLVATTALGALIGARFSGLRPADLLRYLPASVALVLVMAAIAIPAGIGVGVMVGVGPTAGLLAFAPGSMEMMIAVSLTLNAAPAYVAAHHLARMLMLLAFVPFLSAQWQKRRPDRDAGLPPSA